MQIKKESHQTLIDKIAPRLRKISKLDLQLEQDPPLTKTVSLQQQEIELYRLMIQDVLDIIHPDRLK